MAIYPFYCFWFFKPFLKMNVKEFSFSCVSLFNYQGSCRLTASIFYHIVFCLSSTFLKSFFAAFRHLCSFATAILDYHICISLSRTFLNFFQSFSTASLSFFATARLDYHIFPTLSTTFFFYFTYFSPAIRWWHLLYHLLTFLSIKKQKNPAKFSCFFIS